jgi:hypothetical protein
MSPTVPPRLALACRFPWSWTSCSTSPLRRGGATRGKFDTSMANDFVFCYKLDIVYSISRVIAMPFELAL